jgi:hypothetical protein
MNENTTTPTAARSRKRLIVPLAGLLVAAAITVGSGADFVANSVNAAELAESLGGHLLLESDGTTTFSLILPARDWPGRVRGPPRHPVTPSQKWRLTRIRTHRFWDTEVAAVAQPRSASPHW